MFCTTRDSLKNFVALNDLPFSLITLLGESQPDLLRKFFEFLVEMKLLRSI